MRICKTWKRTEVEKEMEVRIISSITMCVWADGKSAGQADIYVSDEYKGQERLALSLASECLEVMKLSSYLLLALVACLDSSIVPTFGKVATRSEACIRIAKVQGDEPDNILFNRRDEKQKGNDMLCSP